MDTWTLVLSLQILFVQFIYDSIQISKSTQLNDTRCYFNVHSKADISQLNLPHGTDN